MKMFLLNLDLGLINRKCNHKEKDKFKKEVFISYSSGTEDI